MAAVAPLPSDFGSFYRGTLGPLRNYLARILGGQAEAQDVAQNAFVRVHSAMHEQTVTKPRSFLFTTARRLALDELRRRRRRPVDYVDGEALKSAPSQSPRVEEVVMARQELARLEQMLEKLPSGCRQVFLLCKVENLTHHEISERMGIARSTVEKQLTRAFRLLREAYDEADAALERAPSSGIPSESPFASAR